MKNIIFGLAALAASSFFYAPTTLAQNATKPFAPKVQPPSTKDELITKEPTPAAKPAVENNEPQPTPQASYNAPAPRRLQQHGFGIGLGQTFLLGKMADYGDNKITADLFYTYAASYSFDLVVNGHFSQHKDDRERTKLMGLNAAIKSRLFEFDNFSPYIMGGLGFYAPRVRRVIDGDAKWSESKITFGANFGGGIDLRLNDNYVVGVLGQLHWPFTVKQDDQPDVKGYYFKLLITLGYLF